MLQIKKIMNDINENVKKAINKINEKDPSFGENFRTLVQRNIYPDRR